MTNSVRKSWKRSSKSVERMLSPGLRSSAGTNYDTSVQRRTEREKLILFIITIDDRKGIYR